MIEPEITFADLSSDMGLAEDFLRYVVRAAITQCEPELRFLTRFYEQADFESLVRLVESPFERISYTDALKVLSDAKKKFEYPVEWGMDLQTEHERYLAETVFKCPVIVKDYPKDLKAFYMRLNDDGRTVAAMDLLIPGVGELLVEVSRRTVLMCSSSGWRNWVLLPRN